MECNDSSNYLIFASTHLEFYQSSQSGIQEVGHLRDWLRKRARDVLSHPTLTLQRSDDKHLDRTTTLPPSFSSSPTWASLKAVLSIERLPSFRQDTRHKIYKRGCLLIRHETLEQTSKQDTNKT